MTWPKQFFSLRKSHDFVLYPTLWESKWEGSVGSTVNLTCTVHKNEVFHWGFLQDFDRKLRIWSYLLKKFLMENFIFFAVMVMIEICSHVNLGIKICKLLSGASHDVKKGKNIFFKVLCYFQSEKIWVVVLQN